MNRKFHTILHLNTKFDNANTSESDKAKWVKQAFILDVIESPEMCQKLHLLRLPSSYNKPPSRIAVSKKKKGKEKELKWNRQPAKWTQKCKLIIMEGDWASHATLQYSDKIIK